MSLVICGKVVLVYDENAHIQTLKCSHALSQGFVKLSCQYKTNQSKDIPLLL